ncbi:MAG: prepilin peptidase [bacterium]|nr:prepilin peptidase [bacterium]
MTYLLATYITILGLIVGSFLNVLIYRLPRGRGVVAGRSSCPNCRKTLSWVDLVPVFSWILLKGKCRNCHKKISWQYPLVELATGLLFLGAYLRFDIMSLPDLAFSLFLLSIFVVLIMTDWRHLILPDGVILFGIGGALIYGVLQRWIWHSGRYDILSMGNFLAAIMFFGVLYLVWWASSGTWLGLGDAKLMGLIALVFGTVGALFIFYTAIIIGGIIGLGLYLSRRADLKTKLPLGSYICLVAILYVFQGLWLADQLNFYLLFR